MKLQKVLSPVLLLLLVAAVLANEHHTVNHDSLGKFRLPSKEGATYWRDMAQQLLRKELQKEKINTKAKNIVFFLGDGMSISTVTAARIYKGQKAGQSGEEAELTFDKFPYAALSRTYCTNAQVADSACSGTAFLGGVKTDIETIGLDENVEHRNCATQNDPANRVDSVLAWAQAAGKGTGIVTTTRVTHATPAAAYAHVANLDWEYDGYVVADGQNPDTCDDIAEQLIHSETGQKFKVILGGGRAYFLPNATADPETGNGLRGDGKNLIDQWKSSHPTGAYVWNKTGLLNQNLNEIDSLLGLFSQNHMDYFIESGTANNPTLEEMTRTAITMLQKETNGYVLLVEGGRIDHGHHEGRAKVALEEALEFDKAIGAALNMTSTTDTLIIVTADHSHTMTINGYSARGNNLLGLTGRMGTDNLPYATLSYANGPGYRTAFVNGIRVNLSGVDTTANSYKQPAGVPLQLETHGGDDVAIFAIGPQAHMFQGVYEQHYIAHVMGYAACIGSGMKFCDAEPVDGSANQLQISLVVSLLAVFSVLRAMLY